MGRPTHTRYGCAVKLLELIVFLKRPRTKREVAREFKCCYKTAQRMIGALEQDFGIPLIVDTLGLDQTTEEDDHPSGGHTNTFQVPKKWIYEKFIL